MALAIFDLDHTLIGGDSDQAFGQYLAEEGLVDAEAFQAQSRAFYQQYMEGTLDIIAHLRHSLSPLTQFSMDELASLHADFFARKIRPMLLPKAHQLLAKHRAAGDFLLVITATNHFVAAPIAEALGVDDVIACDAEIKNNRYTGEPTGIPSFREGKVTRLEAWLEQHPHITMEGSYFYSDSFNDLPLLERATHAVAVDADDNLQKAASERGWPSISLR
ncbi:HAD family hydrolase [Pokkaliibacter sp. CJK22405]|uniref:histidinol-phosphatase n=1 Tax=Pokkaliibacter sp. CJK22405 TaxID=3384615 RepID=UPI003984E49C